MLINAADISRLSVYTDGGSRGNPGPAGTGWVVFAHAPGAEIILKKCGNYLGEATNNQAEYRALVEALEWISENLTKKDISLYLDSELIVKQIQGLYKMKNPDLKPLYLRVKELLSRFPSYQIAHVPRSQNALADSLVNAALDKKGSVNS